MSIQLVMPFNHLILSCPPLLLPSIFPSISVFANARAPSKTKVRTRGGRASAAALKHPMSLLMQGDTHIFHPQPRPPLRLLYFSFFSLLARPRSDPVIWSFSQVN